MAKNKNGGSRGYCFLIFKSVDAVQRALQAGKVFCNGRIVNCRPIMRGTELKQSFKNIDKRRIICSNLDSCLDEEEKDELLTIFKKFGKVENSYFSRIPEVPRNEDSGNWVLHMTFEKFETIKKIFREDIFFKGIKLKIEKYQREKMDNNIGARAWDSRGRQPDTQSGKNGTQRRRAPSKKPQNNSILFYNSAKQAVLAKCSLLDHSDYNTCRVQAQNFRHSPINSPVNSHHQTVQSATFGRFLAENNWRSISSEPHGHRKNRLDYNDNADSRYSQFYESVEGYDYYPNDSDSHYDYDLGRAENNSLIYSNGF
jgi:hypothetical protein